MNTIIENIAPDLQGPIATLGDAQTSITCSHVVAKTKYPTQSRMGARTFEEAAAMVKDGRAKLLLVPGAYPAIGKFLMDEELLVADTFMMKIPELAFGNTVNDVMAPLETIYHHAAVTSLLPKVPGYNAGTRFVASDSNEEAYEAMVKHGERAGCVSNKAVFDYYGRPTLLTLRTEREMTWAVFVARHSTIKKGKRA